MTLRWPVVLFDLDGTLIDSVDLIVASYRHVLDRCGRGDIREAEIRTWIGVPLRQSLEPLFPQQWEEMQTVYRAYNHAHHDASIRACTGTGPLLRELASAGATAGVVTAKARGLADRGLALCGMEVPVIAGLEDTTAHKPAPDPLIHALAIGGWSAAEAVYIGDAATDLRAASAAGMESIGVTWGAGTRADLEAEGPVAVVDDVEQLRAVLGLTPLERMNHEERG